MSLTCPYCRDTIAEAEKHCCPTCSTPHHLDCWNDNGGCTVFGCENAPSDEPGIVIKPDDIKGGSIIPDKPPVSYLVHRNGQQLGPYEMQQLLSYSAEGRISPSDLVWCQGMAEWLPLSQFLVGSHIPSPSPRRIATPLFLYIPLGRLVGMVLLSFGIYGTYWLYKNWRFLKERDLLNIRPFWRAVFGVLFIYSLLNTIKEYPETQRICPATFSAGGLSAALISLSVIGNALGRSNETAVSVLGIVITLTAFVFILPVQKYINAVNEIISPRPHFHPWSTGHIVCASFGVIIWLLLIAGLCG